MSKQGEAWKAYARSDPHRVMPKAQLWTAGYLAASIPLCALLERIEWAGPGGIDMQGAYCPECDNEKGHGHVVGCALDAYLSEDRARRASWAEATP